MLKPDNKTNMTAEAITYQTLDTPVNSEWIKVIAPAKVNLYLGVGSKQENGYHEVSTVLHALNLHDVLYLRSRPNKAGDGLVVQVTCVARGEVKAPKLKQGQNIAERAIKAFAQRLSRTEDEIIEVRIEKHIPFQAGLGGGSSDAAAALVGAAKLWGVDAQSSDAEKVAHTLGSDVTFFLYGGCAYLEGTGEKFVHALEPIRDSVVLVKPAVGVSTAAAYQMFDRQPLRVPKDRAQAAASARRAFDVMLYNNLASASEQLLPELAFIRAWLLDQGGVRDALLCGSGSATFAICENHNVSCDIATEARKRGWWARTTSFGSSPAALVM